MYRNAKNVGYYMIGKGALAQLGDLLTTRREAQDGPAVFFLDHYFEGNGLAEPKTPQMVFTMQLPRPVPPMSFIRHAVALSGK